MRKKNTMKYIQTYEQYIVPAHSPEPILKWDILRFLSNRNTACSIHEILGNFPDEEETIPALKSLVDKFYVDGENGTYKATKDGSEYMKHLL